MKNFVLLSLLAPAAAVVVAPAAPEKFDFKTLMAQAKQSQQSGATAPGGVVRTGKPWVPKPAAQPAAPLGAPPAYRAPPTLPVENAHVRDEPVQDESVGSGNTAPEPVESQAAAAKRRLAEQLAANSLGKPAAAGKPAPKKLGGMDFAAMLNKQLAGGPPPPKVAPLNTGTADTGRAEDPAPAEDDDLMRTLSTRTRGAPNRRKPTPRHKTAEAERARAEIERRLVAEAEAADAVMDFDGGEVMAAKVADDAKLGVARATDGDYPVNRVHTNYLSDDDDDDSVAGSPVNSRDSFSSPEEGVKIVPTTVHYAVNYDSDGSTGSRDSFSSTASKRDRHSRARRALASDDESSPEPDFEDEVDVPLSPDRSGGPVWRDHAKTTQTI